MKTNDLEVIGEQLRAMENACDTLEDGFYQIRRVIEFEIKTQKTKDEIKKK